MHSLLTPSTPYNTRRRERTTPRRGEKRRWTNDEKLTPLKVAKTVEEDVAWKSARGQTYELMHQACITHG